MFPSLNGYFVQGTTFLPFFFFFVVMKIVRWANNEKHRCFELVTRDVFHRGAG